MNTLKKLKNLEKLSTFFPKAKSLYSNVFILIQMYSNEYKQKSTSI